MNLGEDHSNKFFGLMIGMAVVVLFLGVVSLAPQVGEKFGQLATKKESQESFAAEVMTAPCSSSAGGYGDVDGVGGVQASDATLILRYVGGMSTSVDFTNDVKKRANVSGVSGVDAFDATLIQKYVSGLNVTFPMCVDHDSDGFVDGVESYIGTDPYKSCGVGAWPPDFDNNRTVNATDEAAVNPYLNSTAGAGNYNKRYDLNGDGMINQVDKDLINASLAKTCTIASLPVLNFSVSPSTIEVGKSVNITWSSSGAVAPCDASSTYANSWTGQKALSGNSTVTLSQAGSYTFSMKCYGPGGIKEIPKTIKVNPLPCGGNPTLSLSTTTVTYGGSVRATAGGVSNCTQADKINFMISQNNNWTLIKSCTLASSNSCYIDFLANYSGGQVIAFLDAGANGSLEGSSNQIFLTINPAQQAQQNEPKGWPAIGKVGEYNGYRVSSVHADSVTGQAIDVIQTTSNANVYTTMDGTAEVGYASGCGNYVIIRSSTGYLARYCHLNTTQVSNGAKVSFRSTIGTMGTSGGTDGSIQVHYGFAPGNMGTPYLPAAPLGGHNISDLDDSVF